MVHARTIGDKTYTLEVSGKLWRNSLIMQDKETQSLWSHISGEALDGPAAGEKLEILPAFQTTWARWVSEHPETLVLKKSEAVEGSRYAKYMNDPEKVGMFPIRAQMKKMPGKTMVQGISYGGEAFAIRDNALAYRTPHTVNLGGRQAVLYRSLDGGVRAWLAPTGQELTFQRRGRQIRDKKSGTRWDLSLGLATNGRHSGLQLQEIPVRQAFWFAWLSFYPKTKTP